MNQQFEQRSKLLKGLFAVALFLRSMQKQMKSKFFRLIRWIILIPDHCQCTEK
jgi:hypothetical protein